MTEASATAAGEKLVRKVLPALLQPGERLIAACRAMRPGQLGRQAAATLADGTAGRRISHGGDSSGNALGFPGMVLTLTDRRLIALGQRGQLRGRATREVRAIIDRPSVTSVETSGGRGPKLLQIALTLADGRSAMVNVARLDLKAGQALAEALRSQVAR
jgi:hypothetical protein